MMTDDLPNNISDDGIRKLREIAKAKGISMQEAIEYVIRRVHRDELSYMYCYFDYLVR